MSSKKRASKYGCAIVLWILILGGIVALIRFVFLPREETKLQEVTGSKSLYEHEIVLAADSFSGYAVFRSDEFGNRLKSEKIRLDIRDDEANYSKRIRALKDGSVHLAVFTIDSFVKAGAELGTYPGTIILVIDESKGADAIVGYRQAFANIDDLDGAEVRIVLTPDSPSEFLARVVIAHFSLPSLPAQWWVAADGVANVYKQFQSSNKQEKRAYVLWEPYVSKALADPDAHTLLDTSQLSGYIVDVLVANRGWIRDQPKLAQVVVEAYLRALYTYGRTTDGMIRLVQRDAQQTGGERLTNDQAQRLVRSIQWKTTLENYAHFGLLSAQETQGLRYLEDIITDISDVLVKTEALSRDPVAGQAHTFFYDQVLRKLQAERFHPGRKINILKDIDLGKETDQLRGEAELPPLSDREWEQLVAVGTMQIEPISFGRGKATISRASRRSLLALAKKVKAWPEYYLLVTGHARAEGDAEANRRLATQRAEHVVEFLVQQGIGKNRTRARTAEPSTRGGAAQSVSFTVGRIPY